MNTKKNDTPEVDETNAKTEQVSKVIYESPDEIDLSVFNRDELVQLIDRVNLAIEHWDTTRKVDALAAARKVAEEMGYSLDALLAPEKGSSKTSKKPGRTIPQIPRYRNPDDPTQTWTGHGRRPGWILELQEKHNNDLSAFEISA